MSHEAPSPFSVDPTSNPFGGLDGPTFSAFYDAPAPNPTGRFAYRTDVMESEPRSAISKVYTDYRHVTFSDTEYEKSVVKSAHRALQVFEFFAEYGRPASASEIAVNLDFPQSSTSMLLRSLVSLGYLHYFNGTRLFAPTLRLSLISAWQPERVSIAADILRMMHKLHEETGECVMLAEQYRHYVRYIYVLQSADPDKVYYVPHGTLRPICTTAFGQMLLTEKSDKDLRTIVHRARSDQDSIDYGVNLDAILTAVEKARKNSYAYTSRKVNDFRSYQLAAMLPARRDDPQMTVGITSYGDRFLERRPAILERLMALVGELTDPAPAPASQF